MLSTTWSLYTSQTVQSTAVAAVQRFLTREISCTNTNSSFIDLSLHKTVCFFSCTKLYLNTCCLFCWSWNKEEILIFTFFFISGKPVNLDDYIILASSNPKQFACAICGKTFGMKHHVANHLESQHFPCNNQYTCTQCDSVFNTKHKLQRHMRCHKASDL